MQQITPTAHSVPIYSPSAESLAPSYHRQHLSSFDPQDAEAQQFLAHNPAYEGRIVNGSQTVSESCKDGICFPLHRLQ
ncbi:hypothetical protein NEOLEDRAFT_1137178 [Neolentinus lepideus HHB14362 ss-1]|uniref:Uncharacterized protein n=1 Tax=Neolentinus lepideus HHB14362 ss-1 TaxID=1314782 RepID=A0A165QYD0_9AGAM|nr:hypothetical protein NEOLEDRAFT_1142484 [Neolentinus lepideus HHB14362 ss-1]KZT23050.1 hypothetical protein NEOLEDRAFT_1137178 [Neolentinus lepideus HHB14362 ss-1]